MRRIVLWALSTLSVVVLLFGYSTSTSGPLPTAAPTSFVSGSTAGSTVGSTPAAGSGSGTAAATAPSVSATTLTGDVVQTQWGPVQVAVSMSGGKLTGVSVLQYPSGNGRDVEINNQALPILIQETLDQQSANIDMVSGATVTSGGYLQSLQSALDQA